MAKSHPSQGATSTDNDPEGEKSTECRYCDRDFDSYMARRKHEGMSHDEPYQDKEVLERMYHDQKMSMADIADEFGVGDGVIRYWLNENNIETRGVNEHQSRSVANYRMDDRGYMHWCTYIDGRNYYVQVHRLLAVAEYGYEQVAGKVVHHKNNNGWDNRPENIELMTAAEHARHHHGSGE